MNAGLFDDTSAFETQNKSKTATKDICGVYALSVSGTATTKAS